MAPFIHKLQDHNDEASCPLAILDLPLKESHATIFFKVRVLATQELCEMASPRSVSRHAKMKRPTSAVADGGELNSNIL